MTNNVSGTYDMHGLIFGSSATTARTLNGNAMRLFDFGGADPYIQNDSSATHVINLNLSGDGDSGDPLKIRLNASGGLVFGGSLNNQGSFVDIVGSATSAVQVTFSGAISGSGGLYKENTNTTAVLNASNSYSGDTLVFDGALVISNNSALGSSTAILGSATGTNAATLRLGQDITNSRNIIVRAGSSGAKTLQYSAGAGTGAQAGNITLSNSMAFNVAAGGTMLFSGTVNMPASGADVRLALDGGGTLISTGNSTGANSNNYQVRVGNGTLVIGGGTLIARTNVGGLGHGIDLGVDLNGNIVDAVSSLRASNGVTVSNAIFASTTNGRGRVLGASGENSSVAFSGPVGLTNANLWLDASNAQTVTVSGAITNFGGTGNGLVKTNAGLAVLTASNSYNGTTTVTNGTLRISHGSALGSTDSGTIVGSGASLELSNSINVSGEALTIAGTGPGGNGALRNLSGANTNTGSLTLSADSRVQVETNTSFVQSGSVALGANTLTLGGSGTTTISGAVTGSGALTKADSGVVTLNNNANSFGLLTLNGGTLIATNNTRSTGLAGAAGALLDLRNPDDATKQFFVDGAGTNTFAGVVSGTSQFVKRGPGMQIFTGTNSNTSGIYIDGGSVNFQGAATAGSASLIDIGTRTFADRLDDSAELRLGGTGGGRDFTNALAVWTNTDSATRVLASENTSGVNTWSGNITNAALANGGFVISNAAGGAFHVSGAVGGTGNLTKLGDGGLILSASNSYSGTTTLSNGTLTVAHSYALGTGALAQASGASTLRFSNSVTVTNTMSVYNVAFSGSGNTLAGIITNNNATYDVATGETNSITGYLTGTGGVTKIGGGGLILAGASNNTYTGATAVNNGSLILSNSSGNAIHNSSGISVNGSGSSLVLGNSNMIGDGIGLTLDGGTFITGTGTAGYAETLGTLTLSSGSTIDFGSWAGGAGTRNLNFADSSAISWAAGTLVLTNWVQMTNSQSGEYARIYFGNTASGLTSGQLDQIKFHIGGDIYGATILADGEVVPYLTPIPEPRVYAAVLVLLGIIVWRERRRLAGCFRRFATGPR